MKIDKEKNLKVVMEEIFFVVICKKIYRLYFIYNEKKFCFFKNKGNLDNLGICFGLRFELKMKIFFIEVEVCFLGGFLFVCVRCSF